MILIQDSGFMISVRN